MTTLFKGLFNYFLIHHFLGVLLILLIVSEHSGAQQLNNDDIENRLELYLDSIPINSSTNNTNVQWNCVNKKLTSKCLIYHNDQWFTIRPSTAGPFYLNVFEQKCREANGVQLIIIEGNACKTDSYKLHQCIEFTDQADFFVMLDSLRPEQEYLVNVDGFLGDICDFKIEFSSEPKGVPIDLASTSGDLGIKLKDSIIHLNWALVDSVADDVHDIFVVRKKSGSKKSLLLSKPLRFNAKGIRAKDFAISDTISEKADYEYRVYIRNSRGVFLFAKNNVSMRDSKPKNKSFSNKQQIDYFLRRSSYVSIKIVSPERKVLFSMNKSGEAGRNVVTLDFTELLKQGYQKFNVVIKAKNYLDERQIVFSK